MRALALILGIALPALAASGATDVPARPGAYHGAMATEYPDWFKLSFLDFNNDIAEASAAGKRLIVLFTQDNCPYCHALVHVNLAQRTIEQMLRERFDVVAVNLWGDREVAGVGGARMPEKDFGAALRVQFTPTLLFFDEAGRVVLRLNGYVPPSRFQLALEWVSERLEHEMPFRELVAQREQSVTAEGALTEAPFFAAGSDARPPGKAVAVFFEQRDCPDCVVLHRRVLTDPEVRAALERTHNVRLDLWADTPVTTPDGRETTAREWARALDIQYAPAIVLFGEDGREAIRWESSFRVFHTAGMLEYVSSGEHLREPSFQRFLSARADQVREAGRDVDIWRYADEPVGSRP
jgi:thioredoxin-related protein